MGIGFQGALHACPRPTAAFDNRNIETTVDINKAGFKPVNNELVKEPPTASTTAMVRQGGEESYPAPSEIGRGWNKDCKTLIAGDKKNEEEAGFGLVVLSASLDGTIRAWETLGNSEKYRMRHPIGEEVTSMLVLPGESILATGEITSLTCRCATLWIP